MLRFAVVHLGEQADAVARIATRLQGGEITVVVEPTEEVARRQALRFAASVWATSIADCHERLDAKFDAWVASTPLGLLLAPHDNRPLELRPERWLDNAAGWMWGHSYRFLPSVQTVRESLDAGKLGAPGLVRVHRWQSAGAVGARELLAPQLDLIGWLVAQRPVVVFAQRRSDAPSAEYLQVHVGFADDRMALVDCAACLPKGDDYYTLSVIGSNGAAYADDHRNMQLIYRGGRPQAARTGQGDRALLATIQEFIDATAGRRPPLCGAEDWRRAQRLLAAVDRSLESGQSVKFEEA